MPRNRAREYIKGVTSGEIVACKWTKLAVQRHLNDLKRQNTEDFPFKFSPKKAQQKIDFIQMYCYHVKGRFANEKRLLLLEPWEQFILWEIFGWVGRDGFRRYTTAFIEVAKKNGKSTLAAAVGLAMEIADNEEGAEVYSCATVKDQAKIVFSQYAREMAKKSKDLQEYLTIYKHSLWAADSGSSFSAVASDVDSLDGKNVHLAIIDEYHAHKTDGVYNIMRFGMSSRDQPLLFVITTAGFDASVPCWEEEDYSKRVLSGDVVNENYFCIVYTLDMVMNDVGEEELEDWTDQANWVKANPNLGVGKPIKRMLEDFNKAREIPSEQIKFKNKHLNIWTRNRMGWIRAEDWGHVETDFDLEELKGRKCYAGVDLSKTIDATAYSLCFPWDDDVFRVYTRIFLPDFDIEEREKRERFEWLRMAAEGHVILTSGRTVDYDYIQTEIEADLKMYSVEEIGFDPWNASQFMTNLAKIGLEDKLIEMSQGIKTISPAAKDFETKVLNGKLQSYHNPVMVWMMGNTEIVTDSNGNIRPVKPKTEKSHKHIDGIYAGMLALDRAVRNLKVQSVYETRGLRTVTIS